jgi:hypothetical protein
MSQKIKITIEIEKENDIIPQILYVPPYPYYNWPSPYPYCPSTVPYNTLYEYYNTCGPSFSYLV